MTPKLVYDKKMLWRANLYRDEEGADWNKNNPWNAPPLNSNDKVGVYVKRKENGKDVIKLEQTDHPKWWSPEWGYNEWNRVDTGQLLPDVPGLNNLFPGNGEQTVKFMQYVALEGRTNAKSSVPYSYPLHFYEDSGFPIKQIPGGNVTPPGELKKPEGYLRYDDKFHTIIKPNSFDVTSCMWVVADDGLSMVYVTVAPDPNDLDEFGMPKYNIVDSKEGVTADYGTWRGDSGSMDSPFDFNYKMRKQYSRPNPKRELKWYDYLTTPPEGVKIKVAPLLSPFDTVSASESTPFATTPTITFIPGLGLWYYTKAKDDVFNDYFGSWIIEAGTDCVGFAKRATGYQGNAYAWTLEQNPTQTWKSMKLKPGMMEYNAGAGTANVYDVINSYKSERNFPKSGAYSNTIITHTAKDPINKIDQSLLKSIVPGDIFVIINYANNNTNYTHIGIVQGPVYDAGGNVTDIELIEATYWGSDAQVRRFNISKDPRQYVPKDFYILRLK
jgi:hypothetical protein